ncbi:LuxR C-terminal-related transcriptional regulator [Georgenia ruanii]|uniref:AAA family ATPase n=1 Tax=Georgenia ruanii TaxID=348442 RepID=A0A7J9UUC4_9MICO|nr:LuxR C-terminal-related transcriptional regulator [Georgenia ruanii]MPV88207.1 AAA family ATPase [Georgenia ruanii]
MNPRLIERAALLAALDAAAAGKVTLISAPAGSGKTSLIRAWANRPGQPYRLAMVQVPRDQRDAQLFWLALLTAAREARGTVSDAAEPPAPTPDFDGQAMVDRVLAELAARSDPAMLIVDDLHELNSPEALARLTDLLTRLPAHVHAILAMRHDLPVHLHQLRLAGELAEIRATDLRFTEGESRRLLDASDIALSDAGVALLHQRTEGWAAGLRLAVISLTGHPDPERFVAEFTGSDRTVAEYLIAEMLDRQPADVQRLLLCTSLVERFTGELADQLTGGIGAERTLLALEDANAFVVSLDPERTWFRYHHLFGDLLRLELRRAMPAEVPELHRRAATWFLAHGWVVDAIRHTQAVGDWSGAARLLTDHSLSLMLDGQTQTMRRLLTAFPLHGADADLPELALARAAVEVVEGRLDEAAAHLAVAESQIQTASHGRRHRLQLAIVALRLSLARRRGHLSDVVDRAAEVLAPMIDARTEEDIALYGDLRAVALMNLGTLEAWSLGAPDGERHLQEGAALARRLGRPYLEVGCLAQLGFAAKIRSVSEARRRCEEAIALAEQHGWGTEWIVAPALVTLAETMIWTGELDEGQRWLQRTTQALQSDTGPGIRQLLHRATGMLHAGSGRFREALEEFNAAEQLQSQLACTPVLATQASGWRLATQARLGKPGLARATLATLPHSQAQTAEICNARATISLAEGDPAAALAALPDGPDEHVSPANVTTAVEARLLAARAHEELGDHRAAKEATEGALALAEPDRLVLPFAMTGSRQLLETLPRHETAHAALVIDILDVLGGSSLPVEDRFAAPPTERLSPSELRVLRYLPTNLSRPEIARELSVSVNTVNTHVRNIYAKLQARDRSSAVDRARELRLLSPETHVRPRQVTRS